MSHPEPVRSTDGARILLRLRRHVGHPGPADVLDRAIVAIGGVLVVASGAVLIPPSVHPWVAAPGVDIPFDAVTTLVTSGVTVLAWMRYRERGEFIGLYQTAAFLVLAVANFSSLVAAVASLQGGTQSGMSGETPAWVLTAARLLAATLLVAGNREAIAGRPTRHPGLILFAPLAGLIVLTAIAADPAHILPPLGLSTASAPGAVSSPSTPFGAAVQLAGAVLFAWAAALTRHLYRREHDLGDGYLVIGLIFAAFAQVHLAWYPPIWPGVVTAGDLLRLAFDLTLLLGIEAEARRMMRALLETNETLQRLRAAEADRAALEERTRVSREIHDGLAQDLWVAKLKVGRLATLPQLGAVGKALCRDLDSAIDAGLTEARQAVLALRYPTESAAAFPELLSRYVEDFADRFGLRAQVELEGGAPTLEPRVEAELMRIAQEALTNVRRHADATVIRVRISSDDGRVELTVDDNGKGFDPSAVSDGGFGLTSMRERAALIGGRLSIDSRPRDGTRVRVEVGTSRTLAAAAAVST